MSAHHLKSAAVMAATLLSASALSACSSDAPSEGWKQLEGERVTVEYPQDWTEREGSGVKWSLAAEGEGEVIQVADPLDDSRTAAGAIGTFRLRARLGLDDYQPGALRDITVEGADTALVQTFTYTDDGDKAQGAWIIVGQRDPAATIAVTIAGTEVDDELISHVTDTLRYERSDEPVPDQTSTPQESEQP